MRRVLTVAAAIIAGASSAAAQERPDTVRLRELVVTATRLETPITEAPGAVTVLTGAAMRERGQRFLVDALRTVPGVTIAQSAGPGALTSVFIRGGESDYVQVLVDGVQVNDPGGSFDWAHLRTEDVDRVEVVRGPSSVLYGSDAVAGVIQVFTRAGGTPRIEAGMSGARGDRPADASGSFDTRTFDAALTGSAALRGTGTLRYGISGAIASSSGLYEINSDYENNHLNGRLQLVTERTDLAVTARVSDHVYHFPTTGSGAVVDHNQRSTGTSRALGADAGFRLAAPVELRILAGVADRNARTVNPPDGSEIDNSWNTTDVLRRSVDARLNFGPYRETVVTVGAEREWQEAQTAYESTSAFGTFAEETDDRRANTGLYAQVHGSAVRGVAVTLGARLDDNDRFGTFLTGRAAATWQAHDVLRVHAALGTAFKEPTFFENFATGYTRGNPDLEPEQARSREAGIHLSPRRARIAFGATWFDQRFRNLIQYTFSAPTPEAPNFYNVGAARARGLELTANAATGPISASAGYTFTTTRVTDDGFGEDMAFGEGRRLLRRPRHQASINAVLRANEALGVTLGARYVGEREDLDFTDPAQWAGSRTTLQDYAVLDAGITYGIVRGGLALDATAGVRNLLDRRYEEIYNFPTAGRVFHIGLRAGAGL